MTFTEKGWIVKTEWGTRPTRKGLTKKDAIDKAIQYATRQKSKVFLHNEKGQVKEIKINYDTSLEDGVPKYMEKIVLEFIERYSKI